MGGLVHSPLLIVRLLWQDFPVPWLQLLFPCWWLPSQHHSPALFSKLQIHFCNCLVHTSTWMSENYLTSSMFKAWIILLLSLNTPLNSLSRWMVSVILYSKTLISSPPTFRHQVLMFQIRKASHLFPPFHVYKHCPISGPKPLLISSQVFWHVFFFPSKYGLHSCLLIRQIWWCYTLQL